MHIMTLFVLPVLCCMKFNCEVFPLPILSELLPVQVSSMFTRSVYPTIPWLAIFVPIKLFSGICPSRKYFPVRANWKQVHLLNALMHDLAVMVTLKEEIEECISLFTSYPYLPPPSLS